MATGFDKATEGIKGEVVDDAQEGSSIPRAIFTRDQSLDISKLQISQLRIAQMMTAEVKEKRAVEGQFVLSNFPAHDEVILIPLGVQNIRAYKPDPRAAAACHAPTGDFGFGNPGGVCAECPLSQWGEKNDITGRSAPPACKDGYICRLYSVTHRSMVDYQFMAGEKRKGDFLLQQGVSFGWSAFAIRMTGGKKGNNRGDWAVAEIEMLPEDTALVSEDQWKIAQKWYTIFADSQVDTKEQALFQLNANN